MKKLRTQKNSRKCRSKKHKIEKGKSAILNLQVTTQTLAKTIEDKKEKEQTIEYLENELLKSNEQENNVLIQVRAGNKFSPKIKEASMYLQDLGVAESNCSPVIESVITTLTNKKFDGSLPSKSTQCRIASEMASVSRQHLQEVFVDAKNLTVKYDGTTTKKGQHIVETQVAVADNPEGTYLFGIKETVGGTAKDYSECIQETIGEVDSNIMQNITNTMTDQCSTNAAVDMELEILVKKPLNRFRCATHPLDSIHKKCDKRAKELEQGIDFTDSHKLPFVKQRDGDLCRARSTNFRNRQKDSGKTPSLPKRTRKSTQEQAAKWRVAKQKTKSIHVIAKKKASKREKKSKICS